jgi:hypothetical protein
MRFNLGKLILAPAIMAAAALATHTAMAESTVKVPFGFSAAGKSWPAGEYSVQKDLGRDTVTLRSLDTADSFTSLLGPGEPSTSDSHVTLKFEDAGSTHALRTIQYGSQITSRLDHNKHRQQITSSGR